MHKSWVFPVQNMCSICGKTHKTLRLHIKQWKKHSVFRFSYTLLPTSFAQYFSSNYLCFYFVFHRFHMPYNNQLLFKSFTI